MKVFKALLASLILISAAPAFATETPAVSLRPPEVMRLTHKVADYQIATLAGGWIPPRASADTPDPKGWVQGVLFVALADLADHSNNPLYRELVLARGRANAWRLGDRPYHADDQVIGQAYAWAAAHGAGADAIAPTRTHLDAILAAPSAADLHFAASGAASCQERWCWCDALFMAPATWLELTRLTGDRRYAAFAEKEFWATVDFLYDPSEHLFYRDSRFFDRRGPHGEKIFWSRGNGWVFAGLTRMLDAMAPEDPDRPKLIALYKEMAGKLIALQGDAGYWAPSLLSDRAAALPESSGTALDVYGLAWGLRHGLIDRATYEPAVRKGWAALVRAVHPNGFLGFVQPVGDRPDSVGYDDTQFYGVGAFILAGDAVADLDLQ